MENQVCISLHVQADHQRKSSTTHVVSLNSCDLFLTVLVYMQCTKHNNFQKNMLAWIRQQRNRSSVFVFVFISLLFSLNAYMLELGSKDVLNECLPLFLCLWCWLWIYMCCWKRDSLCQICCVSWINWC